jgi:hypothetical protein
MRLFLFQAYLDREPILKVATEEDQQFVYTGQIELVQMDEFVKKSHRRPPIGSKRKNDTRSFYHMGGENRC